MSKRTRPHSDAQLRAELLIAQLHLLLANCYRYDPIGNLTNVDYPGTIMDIVLKYDLLNRPTNVTDLVGTTKFNYTDAGQL